jgi:hypothetical protein
MRAAAAELRGHEPARSPADAPNGLSFKSIARYCPAVGARSRASERSHSLQWVRRLEPRGGQTAALLENVSGRPVTPRSHEFVRVPVTYRFFGSVWVPQGHVARRLIY